ncbi:cAMP-dependent protein kinase regulator [Nematocida parisii]|uniref:Cyclic nucleotide-binding domain-containing protein n=1 Tax=Nematocida parisii (strain ERTm3) TaxID=935791 RepID=I3EDI2_NEMP3|nr:uncharacterized protein NEPG_00549 [Nematocida parisii ERTm1]EIJ87279.1 hypothetical protein NEQG_02614 [Nematocida parisii ERTm3]KAI5130584.1 cAMP-dependent protein kinase regulator [Nematocida parisii]EIJ95024.1 hypothetical protein NEPG_00549 [Nematocida parisii ERTm1]KAI5130887.1 cAMP-dependent protein kinase regulator [Nematocida parisii]KAI5143124.1 cAMP-dependent protein kinase regulator [Nematocida parisii]|eukprot:XP_013058380.1 hypothetical protein NEPG_00549 [Nematocida parisii ERTm1]
MDRDFCKAADIISECIRDKKNQIENPLKFASDTLSLYVINAESENIIGFSESIFRDTIADLLSSEQEPEEISVMEQLPVSSLDYEAHRHRKRRGSVSASGNPYAPLTVHPKSESVSEMLLNILANTRLIARTMDMSQMKKLVSTMFVQHISKGERLIMQGEYGKTMYLVESGEFQILQDGKLKATLRQNSLFGEISLLYSCPRTASVICTIDATVWVVTSDAYSAILMVDQRRTRELVCSMLEKNKKYMSLPIEDKNRILYSSHLINYSKNEKIEVPESGVFMIVSKDAPESAEEENGFLTIEHISENLERGSIIYNGTICDSNMLVLFVPDMIYSMINENTA